MGVEERIAAASIYAGLTEIVLGGILYFVFDIGGFFGYLGAGMVLYGVWHKILLKKP